MSVKSKFGLKTLGVALLFGVSVSAYSGISYNPMHSITLKNATTAVQAYTIGGTLSKGSVAAGATVSFNTQYLPKLSPSGANCVDSLNNWRNDENPRACVIASSTSCTCK